MCKNLRYTSNLTMKILKIICIEHYIPNFTETLPARVMYDSINTDFSFSIFFVVIKMSIPKLGQNYYLKRKRIETFISEKILLLILNQFSGPKILRSEDQSQRSPLLCFQLFDVVLASCYCIDIVLYVQAFFRLSIALTYLILMYNR